MKKRLFVFESNPDFADNSRGFWEYLKDNNNIDTFWCVRNEKMYQRMKENGIQCALFGTDIANEMIDKADCFITSSFEFAYHKKKNQIHVSAWHGSHGSGQSAYIDASGRGDHAGEHHGKQQLPE